MQMYYIFPFSRAAYFTLADHIILYKIYALSPRFLQITVLKVGFDNIF